MKESFIFGLDSSTPNSSLLSTSELYNATGQNSGNLAFHFAVERMIKATEKTINWGSDLSSLKSRKGTAILPLANQVGAHADYGWLGDKVENLPHNLVALGLGAQSGTSRAIPEVPQGTLDWIKKMSEKSLSSASNIGVRGNFTKKVLEHYNVSEKVQVLGCPTLFLNPDKELGYKIAEKLKKPPKRVAVPSGHQKWHHLAKIEQCLAGIVSETNGSYIGQSPFEMFKLTRGELSELNEKQFQECKSYIMPYSSDEYFVEWCNHHGNLFFDIPSWMEHYRKYDFIVGPRIHGVVLGLQVGIPSLCIVHDSRTLELCETLKVPYVMAGELMKGFSLKQLWEKVRFNAQEFTENRTLLAGKFCDFFHSNGVGYNSYLDDMAGM
ncbi:polysaccharide pyruvyl transferase family protein [Alteromonas stellipolaris]|uniref:polysaccharide pyruvyl transferase family protein n=1 Tax=Alteromonas stellipolaris TaxID=233316 RepID=UPI00211747E5|nr:polysaccharide pyruvyl transferase family protein [Alteromonas stellipolaris]MCQ8850415.1 polysaccharide pyruvyl transferase family protein [Alteromonas stellipolaris]